MWAKRAILQFDEGIVKLSVRILGFCRLARRVDGQVGGRHRGTLEAMLRIFLLPLDLCRAEASMPHAFAAILGDGSVVTWGAATFGGDSSVRIS